VTRPDPHDLGELSAHALGLLDGAQARAVDAHLRSCAACRHEWAELRGTVAMLDEVPPEMYLDGTPGGDLVLRRTLRQVRAEKGARHRTQQTRRFGAAAAAAVVAVALLGGGAVVGRVIAPEQAQIAAPAPVPVTVPAGTLNLEGTNGPVAMAATVTPATGWVRLAATVRGIPAGRRCTLFVIGRDGSERPAGSWLVSPTGQVDGTTVNGSAIVAPEDVAAVAVRSEEGEEFIAVRV